MRQLVPRSKVRPFPLGEEPSKRLRFGLLKKAEDAASLPQMTAP